MKDAREGHPPLSLSLFYQHPTPGHGLETADIQTAFGFFKQTDPYCTCIYLPWIVMFRGEHFIVYQVCVCSLFTVCGSSDDRGAHYCTDETEVDITDEGKFHGQGSQSLVAITHALLYLLNHSQSGHARFDFLSDVKFTQSTTLL